jgi:glycine betaine transporter
MGIVLHRKGLPALISTCFYPLLGTRIYGPAGKAIDIVTLVATFFGMCTTIGLGTMQLTAGLHVNWGVSISNQTHFVVLAVVTAGYLASATLPIERGIRVGSNASMIVTLGLMAYLLMLGPTRYILNNFLNATGIYLSEFPRMSLWTDPVANTGWLGSWTIFYWAWWIAWAPFVGIFLARISKGRSVRQFVLAALIAPTLFDMVFLAVFGSTAVSQQMDPSTGGALFAAVKDNVAGAVYVMFERYPLSGLIGVALLFVVYTFFVVSADSCTIVLGMLSSGGNENPRTSLKILWGVFMAVAAGVLLAMNGLESLQTASIVAAFFFAIVMCALCYSIVKMLGTESVLESAGEPSAGPLGESRAADGSHSLPARSAREGP